MAIFKFQYLLFAAALINFSYAYSWSSLGCYTITGNRAVLTQVNQHGELMTPEICQTACGDLGFTMAGTERGDDCWCGNIFKTGSPSHACTTPCNGDNTQMCGGNNRINLYEVQFPSPSSQKGPDALDEISAAQIMEAQELKHRNEKRSVEFHCKRFGKLLC
ncbi:WSC domain-containing protein [Hyaloscypha finlandica]|nr:WSC domain-containing protein [Hyaloscypha finlandica]